MEGESLRLWVGSVNGSSGKKVRVAVVGGR